MIDLQSQSLPFKAYEPTIELRERKSRNVYIEVPYTVETGEAERIAVDWTARGGGSGTSCTCGPCSFPVQSDKAASGIASTDPAVRRQNASRTYLDFAQIRHGCPSGRGKG